MKKTAHFIVRHNRAVLIFMIVLALGCAVLIPQVEVNADMTSYLPDTSNMRIGLNLMGDELEIDGLSKTIQVMFRDLTEEEKLSIPELLADIEYVESVTYDAESEDYNRDPYTLYVLTTEYDYNSSEEKSIEHTVTRQFADYNVEVKNDAVSSMDLPMWVIALALAILFVILLVMCNSWTEPFLFVVTIGIAVVVNMGTNIVRGSIASVTFTIGAILQLILSMDYAIILMNRYRQEYALVNNKAAALESALTHAFSSVASSGLTTVVGLLMLVFMSFRIGFDLGFVLAKGVLISMICTFTVLPGLILIFSDLVMKTTKKVPEIPFSRLTGGIYRVRWVFVPAFILLFAGAVIIQNNTDVSYSLSVDSSIPEIFPPDNSIILLYNNEDEDRIADLVANFEDDEHIKSAVSYPTLLGIQYTTEEMYENIDSLMDGMGSSDSDVEMDFSPELLAILYYDYYAGDNLPEMSMSEFIHFIAEEVAGDETFGDYLDDEILDNMDIMLKFADADTLTVPMTSLEMSELFDMAESDMEYLFLFYYMQKDDVNTGTMTLPVFADFVVNEIADDPDFASMFDADTLSLMDMLLIYTDASAMTCGRSYQSMADIMGMDAEDMKLLYIYYYAMQGSYRPGEMTLAEFTDFLCADVAGNEMFASYFDADTLAEMETLKSYTDSSEIQKERSASDLASFFGMSSSDMKDLYLLYYIEKGGMDTGTMSLPEFADFVVNEIASDSSYSGMFDEDTISQLSSLLTYTDTALMTEEITAAEMADILGMSESTMSILYRMYSASQQSGDGSTGVGGGESAGDAGSGDTGGSEGTGDTGSGDEEGGEGSGSGGSGDEEGSEGSGSTGSGETEGDEGSGSGESGDEEGSEGSGSTGSGDGEGIEDAGDDGSGDSDALAGAESSDTEGGTDSGSGIAVSAGSARYMAASSSAGTTEEQKISVQEMINYLAAGSDSFGYLLGDDMISMLTFAQTIINESVAGTQLSSGEMADLTGMSQDQSRQLYLLYTSRHKDTSAWKISALQFVDFTVSSVLTNSAYSGYFDSDTASQLEWLRTLMHAAVDGSSYDYPDMASLFGMDSDTVKLLYTFHDSQSMADSWSLSAQTVVNFLVSNTSSLGSMLGDYASELALAQKIINGAVAGTAYASENLADLLDIDPDQIRQLYLLYISRHGDTSAWKMSVTQFLDFVLEDVLTDDDYAELIDEESAQLLDTAKILTDAVVSGDFYSPAQMTDMISTVSEGLDEEMMELLYLYYAGVRCSDPDWTMSLDQMFSYLADVLIFDSRFDTLLGDDVRDYIIDMEEQLGDGISQMKGAEHSLLMFYTTYPEEDDETMAFLDDLIAWADVSMTQDYYLIGNSPMVYEMKNEFDTELLMITLLTAISIFIVVAITFHSLVIPLILVLIVQCGVYLTVSTCGLIGYSIYYLALLIVQCILMGATIDYGILYTNCYREARKISGPREAAVSAYNTASHTILTSGLIMILVTAVIAQSPADPTICQICMTISIGAAAAVILIIFMLPGLLMALDRFVVKKQ